MSSSPMKQAARTAKAWSESSILMASRVVTGWPSIEGASIEGEGELMTTPLSIDAAFAARCVRIGRPALPRFFQDPLDVEAILGPVDHHRRRLEGDRVVGRLEIAGYRVVFVVGEGEDLVV